MVGNPAPANSIILRNINEQQNTFDAKSGCHVLLFVAVDAADLDAIFHFLKYS